MQTDAIDALIASAIEHNTRDIAQAVIATHDNQYPTSPLRSLSIEERVRWIEQNLSYISNSIKTGEVVTWSYSYVPNVTGLFDPMSPPYTEVSNNYETILEMEDCMLPYVWRAFEDRPQDLLAAVRRFRFHMLRFIDANVERVQIELGAQLRASIKDAATRGRAETLRTMSDQLSGMVESVKGKLALIYDSVQNGRTDEALALLTATKLLVGDVNQRVQAAGNAVAAEPETSLLAPEAPVHTTQGAHLEAPKAAPTQREACKLDTKKPEPATVPPFITKREADVLHGVIQGKTNAEIAVDLDLSIGTVRNYVSTLLEKLQAENRTQLAILAVKAGMS